MCLVGVLSKLSLLHHQAHLEAGVVFWRGTRLRRVHLSASSHVTDKLLGWLPRPSIGLLHSVALQNMKLPRLDKCQLLSFRCTRKEQALGGFPAYMTSVRVQVEHADREENADRSRAV